MDCENSFTPHRLAFSLAEVAEICGKSKIWAYRRIYAGELKVVSQGGRMLVARAELDRFLSQTEVYNGRRTRTTKKTEKEVVE